MRNTVNYYTHTHTHTLGYVIRAGVINTITALCYNNYQSRFEVIRFRVERTRVKVKVMSS